MDEEQRDGAHIDDDADAREGAFDEQLSLPLPWLRAPEPFTCIVKRDGRLEAFDRRKIAEAIFRAAQSIGGRDRDRAESLASAVSIYLNKQLQGKPPTVDQVNDAVERVLIEMGHASTALAFARYRDRRARVRRLREGDLGLLVRELQEARRLGAPGPAEGGSSLYVRTSSETVITWDRGRIVEALKRETGLDEAMAALVAAEVEQQIERAQIHTLTGSLIRELVDARLVEHGLHEHRERHRRLGVPLYDAQRIVLGMEREEAGESVSPKSTDGVLARAVKREYALAQVFSAPVADAHLRGELHLCHVSLVDRLCRISVALEHAAANGIDAPGVRAFAGPARHAETLLAHMVKLDDILRDYFTSPAAWEHVNVYFAPYIHGRSREAIAQFAQMLVYEFAYRALCGPGAAAEIGLCWGVPESLRRREAVGPGGVPTGKTYAAFEHAAQTLAWELVTVFEKGVFSGVSLPGPTPRIRIDDVFFRTPGHDEFLRYVSRVSAERRSIHYELRRKPESETTVAAPSRADLHEIVLNLPRAAYATRGESRLYDELDRLAALAVQAHGEKRNFLERMAVRESGGPLDVLIRRGDGQALVDLGTARSCVAVEGLNECVQHLCGSELHARDEAVLLAERILQFIGERCAVHGGRSGGAIVVTQNNDSAVSRRFSSLDLALDPAMLAPMAQANPPVQTLSYTTGAGLRRGHGLMPIDGARIEGRLHTHLAGGAQSRIDLPETDPAPESIADFVVKAYRQTQNHRITFQ